MPPLVPPLATIVYLAHTGHVLAADSAGGIEPTLEDLTAGAHLRLRFPGLPDFVNVPVEALKVKRLPAPDDVLDRPQHYTLPSENGPLSAGVAPEIGTPAAGQPGAKAVIVWQDGDDSVVATGTLDLNGAPVGSQPPGATHRLVAYVDGPLYLEAV